MTVDSLVDMSLRACSKIAKRITDIGGMPYSVARPFLVKIDSPEQLHALEEKCEQIIGHDAEIWLVLIKRDIPGWQTKMREPSNPRDWWKVYRKLKQDAISEMAAGADQLQAALNDKNEKQLAEIKPMQALPRRAADTRSRIAYRYQSGKTGSRGGSKMGVLGKIQKEARDAKAARALAEQQIRKRMPTTVTRAPAQFIEDIKTQRQRTQHSPERPIRTPYPLTAIRRSGPLLGSTTRTVSSSPSRPAAVSWPSRPAVSHQQLQEREARLRALKSGKPPPPNNVPSSSPKEVSPRKEIPIISVEGPSTPVVEPDIFLQGSPLSTRKIVAEALARPGSAADSRSASPQIVPLVRKRKKEPELFMAPAKRKAGDVSGNAVLR